MSSNDINLYFHGSISAQILQLLKPLIVGLFFNSIVNNINSILPPTVSNPINAMLKTLPLD